MTHSNFDAEQTEFGYGQLFAVLWRRRFWFLGVFGSVLALSVPLALSEEPTYKSSMQLLIEPNYQGKDYQANAGEDQFIDSGVQIDYATQLNLMRSSGLLQKAVNQLQTEYPKVDIESLRDSLLVYQVVENDKIETKIFEVEYVGEDPVKTEEVLQELQKVYQSYNLEQQEQRLREGLGFITNQLPQVRASLAEAEAELKQFRSSNNLIAPVEEATDVSQALRNIQQERDALKAQYQETLARYTSLQQKLGFSAQEALTTARLSESPRYQSLLNELQKTELALAEQRAVFTDANPILQDLLEKRQNQQQLLQEEAQRVLGNTPAQLDENTLQQQGQLGSTEVKLAGTLVETQTSLESMQARDQSLAQTENRLRKQLDQYPSLIAKYNNLEQEVEVKRNTLQQLLEARQELGVEIDRGGFNWQVVEPPQLGEQTDSGTKKTVLLGGVVGLFLGLVAAFAREAVDDAVRTSEQLKGQVALPLLGVTPKLPQSDARFLNLPWRSMRDRPSAIYEVIQWIPFRESLDLIYKNIQLLNSGSVLNSLVVTSALPGEGKTTLAVGLGLSAARLGQRVLVIDADLRRPSIHEQIEIPNQEGLSTLLAGTELAKPHHLSLGGSTIDVLTAGPIPADPVKLLSSQRMKKLMEMFEQSYDLVLLDTPPVLGTVDAIQAASYCSGVVMVGRLDKVTQSELGQATARLSKLNAIGIIANGARDALSGYILQSELNHKTSSQQFAPN